MKSLNKWCLDNGYTTKIITQNYFIQNLNKSDLHYFSEEIQNKLKWVFYENNLKKRDKLR